MRYFVLPAGQRVEALEGEWSDLAARHTRDALGDDERDAINEVGDRLGRAVDDDVVVEVDSQTASDSEGV